MAQSIFLFVIVQVLQKHVMNKLNHIQIGFWGEVFYKDPPTPAEIFAWSFINC